MCPKLDARPPRRLRLLLLLADPAGHPAELDLDRGIGGVGDGDGDAGVPRVEGGRLERCAHVGIAQMDGPADIQLGLEPQTRRSIL